MFPLSLVKYQMVLQIVIPNLTWWVIAKYHGIFSFPFSRVESIYIFFPKLRHEYVTIAEVYSPDEAMQYILAYANSFVLGCAIFSAFVLISFLKLEILKTKDNTIFYTDVRGIAAIKKNLASVRPAKLRRLLLYFLVLIFFLFIPIAYRPAEIVNSGKQLDAIYSLVVLIFPIFFIAAFCDFLSLLHDKALNMPK